MENASEGRVPGVRRTDHQLVFYQGLAIRPLPTSHDLNQMDLVTRPWTCDVGGLSQAAVTDRLRIGSTWSRLEITSSHIRRWLRQDGQVTDKTTSPTGESTSVLGPAWLDEEHEAYGIDLPPLAERFDRFDEATCEGRRIACSNGETSPTLGRRLVASYQLKDALFPAPNGDPFDPTIHHRDRREAPRASHPVEADGPVMRRHYNYHRMGSGGFSSQVGSCWRQAVFLRF